ncbi:V-type ATP synthase subunit I [Pyrodictium delaneyi]|uniref:A-type ATP synthase subunit I n=1 Tax=Pyrodictium delaneyi TaxID=1273541 RepID=A0A211YNG5_9CREN|nr:V-type ATPase 116kDa subunit family protein [Pyrodictium delaneyi]OWJ54519.1 hypothetical protein Pdsh_06900 [Pyrodictium delaneyi]
MASVVRVILKTDVNHVYRLLELLASLEAFVPQPLSRYTELPEHIRRLRDQVVELAAGLRELIERYSSLLGESEEKLVVRGETLKNVIEEALAGARKLLEEIQELEGHIESLEAEKKRLEALTGLAARHGGVSVARALRRLESLENLRAKLFIVDVRLEYEVRRVLAATSLAYGVYPASPGEKLLLVVYRPSDRELVERLEATMGLRELVPPRELVEAPEEAIMLADIRLQEVEEALREARRELEKLVSSKAGLILGLYELLSRIAELFSVLETGLVVGDRVIVKGYIVSTALRALEAAGKEGWLRVEVTEPGDDAPRPPTRNPLIRAFAEHIRDLYGPPGLREVDPAPVIAATFPLFFGLMFGDIGHGAVLALLGLGLYRLREDYRGYGIIIALCGLWSMVFGVLSGEVFGFHMALFPGYEPPLSLFAGDRLSAEKLRLALAVSLLAGVVHIALALVLGIYTRLRRGDYAGAAAGLAPVLLLYTGGVLYVASRLAGLPAWLGEAGMILLTASPILLLTASLTASRLSGVKPLHVLGEALLEYALSVVELASNTLSYMRLAILYLIHAVLTSMLARAWHAIGLLSLPLLVLGNAGIIALESLMAFIQASRLHFYEFMTKFYEGSGRPYRPVKLSGRHVRVELRAVAGRPGKR